MTSFDYDISIIGAGPSGAIAAALLAQKGYSVCVLEREIFPRFSIGESLLPQCMEFIEEAGMSEAVNAIKAQRKDGAAFHYQGQDIDFDFAHKSTKGPSATFQVIRSYFDKILIEDAVEKGANLFYGTTVTEAEFSPSTAKLHVSGSDGKRMITSRFCLDASGYGRVLPKILDLSLPSAFPSRTSYFTHVKDNITDASHNRNRILITVHPKHKDIWFWLIPFSDGTSSVGVVGKDEYFFEMEADNKSSRDILKTFIADDPNLSRILNAAEYHKPAQKLSGYSCAVKSLYGESYALLGNAGEFLDPVFSSGVTIAMKSASLAANVIDRQLNGETVDWETEFSAPLMRGVETFRAFVEKWYEGDLIDVFFADAIRNESITKYLTSILAGYAWDMDNPYVMQPRRRLKSLIELCQ